MMNKRFVFLICALVAGFAPRIQAAERYQAVVEDLSGPKYLPAVTEALAGAKSSIDMVMYVMNSSDPVVSGLTAELVNAHRRGVKVRVVLDRTGGWPWNTSDIERNLSAYSYLKAQGIDVVLDDSRTLTHAKALVIDDELVIIGSVNWSQQALMKNNEVSCLVRSKELATRVKDYCRRIALDPAPVTAGKTVLVDARFLRMKQFGPALLTRRGHKMLDVYLLLLKHFYGDPQGEVDFNYPEIAAELKMGGNSPSKIGMMLIELERLGLVRRERGAGLKPPRVFLKDFSGDKPYAIPTEDYAAVPEEYWRWSWNRKLLGSDKFCYLMNLVKVNQARGGKRWLSYQKELMKEFSIDKGSLIRGMNTLRRLNIINIEYGEFAEYAFKHDGPMLYTLNGLYDPEALQLKKQELARKYGKKRCEQAQAYARIVFKENDPEVIESIIRNMEEFGEKEVAYAFRQVAKRSPANPKRSYRWVMGILQNRSPVNSRRFRQPDAAQ